MKTKLNLELVGVNQYGNLTIEELESLVQKTLSFYPLNKIFKISEITSIDPPMFMERYLCLCKTVEERNLGRIAFIQKENACVRHLKGANAVVSDLNPIILAHELGHSLGLKHFFASCPYCDYGHIECGFKEYIMCGVNGKVNGFHPDNLKKLGSWLK